MGTGISADLLTGLLRVLHNGSQKLAHELAEVGSGGLGRCLALCFCRSSFRLRLFLELYRMCHCSKHLAG
jgi:hypothetical protein